MTNDPILVKRAKAARAASIGQRIGYLGFVIAVIAFVIGAVTEFNGAIVGIVIGSIVVGSIFLAPVDRARLRGEGRREGRPRPGPLNGTGIRHLSVTVR